MLLSHYFLGPWVHCLLSVHCSWSMYCHRRTGGKSVDIVWGALKLFDNQSDISLLFRIITSSIDKYHWRAFSILLCIYFFKFVLQSFQTGANIGQLQRGIFTCDEMCSTCHLFFPQVEGRKVKSCGFKYLMGPHIRNSRSTFSFISGGRISMQVKASYLKHSSLLLRLAQSIRHSQQNVEWPYCTRTESICTSHFCTQIMIKCSSQVVCRIQMFRHRILVLHNPNKLSCGCLGAAAWTSTTATITGSCF